MLRDDYKTLHSLGFTDEELKELDLWDVAVGDPEELAEGYIRRSKKSDDLASLRKHVRDLVRAAKYEGVKIRHVWFEQRSASKAHVRREQFDGAVAAVMQGLSKTLFVWKTDRLSRRGMGQVGLLLDEFDKRKARLISVVEGLDSSKGSRMVFAILSERARDEAKDIALRVKNGVDAHKAEGKWLGGVVPFGLMYVKGSGKLTRHPTEFIPARRIAIMLIQNKTPAFVADAMNRRGYRGRNGKPFSATGIISLAHACAWAGLVANRERMKDEFGGNLDGYHRGGMPLIGKDGHPVSCGEGVITFAERVKILANLASRSVPGSHYGSRTRGKRAPATTLSATLKCPHCKGPTVNTGASYQCMNRRDKGTSICIGATVNRARTEKVVAEMWQNHILALPPESATLQDIARRWLAYKDPEKEARKNAVAAALDNAVSRELRLKKEFFIIGKISEADFDFLRREIEEQIEQLKAELAELSVEADLSPLMEPEALARLWDGAGVEGQRALLAAAVVSMTFVPAKYRGDRTPMDQRLSIVWRDTTSKRRSKDRGLEGVERTRQRRVKDVEPVEDPKVALLTLMAEHGEETRLQRPREGRRVTKVAV